MPSSGFQRHSARGRRETSAELPGGHVCPTLRETSSLLLLYHYNAPLCYCSHLFMDKKHSLIQVAFPALSKLKLCFQLPAFCTFLRKALCSPHNTRFPWYEASNFALKVLQIIIIIIIIILIIGFCILLRVYH
jgi:hypothetical protein